MTDDFAAAIQAAFPNEDWDEDRLAAFKDAIHMCASGDYEESAEGEGDEPKKGTLALLFGGGSGKKG